MDTATKLDWPAVMRQIHYIEHHYQSLLNIPDSHPAMKKLHKLTHTGKVIHYKTMNYDRVIKLLQAGYNYTEIGDMTGKSDAQIENIAYRNGCKRRTQFHSIYFSDDGKTYYSPSFEALSIVAGENLKVYKVREKLKKTGKLISSSKIYWFEVPDGAMYFTASGKAPHAKHGIDSYIG